MENAFKRQLITMGTQTLLILNEGSDTHLCIFFILLSNVIVIGKAVAIGFQANFFN